MLSRLRNYALIAIVLGVFYFLLTHHILFSSLTQFDLLKKTEPTLKYTFISVRQLNPHKMLQVDALRDAGLGEFMVDRGYLRESRLEYILDKIEEEDESEN